MGRIGDTSFNDLRSLTPRNVTFYAVRYPADTEISRSAADMSQRVQYMANNCPNTRLILGGYQAGRHRHRLRPRRALADGYSNPLPPG